ncbi:hypothetical protein SteCoe_7249 [Stentor coeruleus]|uniref:Cation efflux protein cytoplasmic domain-containing protein n=1 Tax=Stentor coeruleus TaxID=5963 RepID=A0A1R2CMX5_9CILI|nr:hypothetical protein SteCoe_7249 [Stentor coeruleus]
MDTGKSQGEQIEMVQTGISNKFKRHQRSTQKYLKRLYFNIFLSTSFMIGEIIGGIVSDSIALLSDAFHIFTDILGFTISIISLHITKKQATYTMSYGYYRAEVIGALLSIALIWGLTAWLVSEAIIRFITPQEVDGLIMLVTAIAGLIGNVIMGIVLMNTDPDKLDGDIVTDDKNQAPEIVIEQIDVEKDPENPQINVSKKKSLNMRAAIIHVLGDGLQSVGVSIAAGVIYAKPEYTQADPVCTLMFCIVVLATTIPILKDCVKILMEASPSELNMEEVIKSLKEIEDVIDVHDMHVWSLSAGKVSLSCHMIVDNPSRGLKTATQLLKDKYGIGHITIQTEIGDNTEEFICENELH